MLKFTLIYITIFLCTPIFAQEQVESNDSLSKLSYDDLFLKLNYSEKLESRLVYANAYLKKAKRDRDTINIVAGFEILATLNTPDKALKSIDSIIKLTENKPNTFNPANAYLQQGHKHYKKLAYKESLKSYLKANKFSSKYYNQKLHFNSLQGIAFIKNRIGDYKSAIEIHHKNLAYFSKDTLSNRKDDYLNTLFALSVLSVRLKNIDSSSYYNHIGFNSSIKYEWLEKMNQFRLAEGIVKYHKGMYSVSIDSISKSLDILISKNDRPNLIHAYFYLAQNYFEGNKEFLAIKNLIKVDSLYQLTGIIEPDTRDAYKQLNEFYKSNNDYENQLLFLTKLISIDSTYYKNQSLLGLEITNEYELPKLISDKEKLIKALKKGHQLLYYLSFVLVILILLVFVYFRYKQKKQLERFNELLNKTNVSSTDQTEKKNLNLPKEIVDDVLNKIEAFEKNNEFINPKITLVSLAKSMDTNSNYLSKIINSTKNKNFATYLNELRINYALEKIKNDNSFRKYTISAIALEVGFKSAETFSKSFKSLTKIYPSYFIGQIEKSNS